MRNLLDETLEVLSEHGLEPEDVEWVGAESFGHFSWDEFAAVAAHTYYDAGYGAAEVAVDLVVCGAGWWLSRGEYDGSEWWNLHTQPTMPDEHRVPNKLAGGMLENLADVQEEEV